MYAKKQVCKNCLYYNAFYTKGIIKYNKKNFGDCEKLNKQVKLSECCELWKDNSEIKISRQKQCLHYMMFTLENIGEIINLVKTDYDEETPDG